jgi:DNA polymerase-3 subunit epsilon
MTEDISTLDFVAFDTETTGLSPSAEGLVEIAAVRFSLLTGAKEYFQTLVNPRKPIPAQATAVHGITDDMVFTAPAIEQVLPSFFRFIEGAIPVAHNAPFDIGFIALHSMRAGISLPEGPILDSCMFSRRVCTEQPSHRLGALTAAFGIDASTFHRALADAKSCMEVFRHVVGKSCGVNAAWQELVSRHGKLYSFGDASKPVRQTRKVVSLEPIFRALEEKKSVWIKYEGGYSAREISPLLLYAKGAQQYMEATCHLDGIRKSFRLDRIKQVLTGRPGSEEKK